MEKKIRKTYSKEFKNMILELYNSGRKVTELSIEYKVSKTAIRDWINNSKKVIQNDNSVKSDKDKYLQLIEENTKIVKENKILIEENETLKKTISILSRD